MNKKAELIMPLWNERTDSFFSIGKKNKELELIDERIITLKELVLTINQKVDNLYSILTRLEVINGKIMVNKNG